MYLKQKDVKALNGFISQRIETSGRLLEARELTFGDNKKWKNYFLAEKLLHSLERIVTSRGTYWHTNLFRIKDILDHSVTKHFVIYWVIFANMFNSLFYYMFIYFFVLDIYLILYMLICFRTPQMDRPEVNIPLIKTHLQGQECPTSMCQPIFVSITTTPAVIANPH